MLIDALENKGSYSSGVTYNKGVLDLVPKYREALTLIRSNSAGEGLALDLYLKFLAIDVIEAAGNNQKYRITQIVEALDIYMKREYTRIYGS